MACDKKKMQWVLIRDNEVTQQVENRKATPSFLKIAIQRKLGRCPKTGCWQGDVLPAWSNAVREEAAYPTDNEKEERGTQSGDSVSLVKGGSTR